MVRVPRRWKACQKGRKPDEWKKRNYIVKERGKEVAETALAK